MAHTMLKLLISLYMSEAAKQSLYVQSLRNSPLGLWPDIPKLFRSLCLPRAVAILLGPLVTLKLLSSLYMLSYSVMQPLRAITQPLCHAMRAE